MTGAATPATNSLERAAVPFTRHLYEAPQDAGGSYGQAVAAALGVSSDVVFKTLIAAVDGHPIAAIVPSSRRLSLKLLARAAGGKRAAMSESADAERLTGYLVGGISPFGQRRALATYLDHSAADLETMFVSGGRRGLQLQLAPTDLIAATDAVLAPLTG